MPNDIELILILLALFQIKHTLADYFMQTERMLSNRATYAHIGRVQHAAIHAAFSFALVMLVGFGPTAAIVVFAIDAVVHFHVDWLKGMYSERSGDGPDTPGYWRAFGVDQLAHQLTYVGMVWLCVVVFAPSM